ncbi:MAG: helix-turn-helix domain-containing protein [Candidatus Woesearchaeota archaeon]
MVGELNKLGLSPYESKCYLTLVKFGNLFGKDIALKSGVPPTSVYRNLETLQQKGFVQIIQKEPLIYQAVDPEIAISSFINSKKEQLKELEKSAIGNLKDIKGTGIIEKQEQVLEVYSGREQSYQLGKNLIKEARKEFLLIGRGTKQSIIDIIHSLKLAAKNGVNCKFIITINDKNKDFIKELQKSKIKIKYFPLQGFSLLIKDREESQIIIKSSSLKEERVILKIKNKDLSQAHADYFDSVWRKAMPV